MAQSSTLMGLSYAMQGVSSVAGAYGASRAASGQGDYSAAMNETNADFARLNADDAIQRGNRTASGVHASTEDLKGKQRTGFAANGVDVNTGSAAQVQSDSSLMGSLDELTVKNNAWREAWGYKVQALNYDGEAKLARLGAGNTARNTLLTGGLNAAAFGAKSAQSFGGGGSPGSTGMPTDSDWYDWARK